ncbi:MAG: hypothetical protein AB8I08_01120 [Sandaracinaceae bacterium]
MCWRPERHHSNVQALLLFSKEAIVVRMRLGWAGCGRGLVVFGLFAALVILVRPAPSAAQASPVSLTTDIAPALRSACPTPLAVRIRLDAYLAASDAPVPVSATVRVRAAAGDRFSAEVVLVRGARRSSRTAEGASCAAVLEAATLVIAIAADPEVAMRGAPDEALPLEAVRPRDGTAEDAPADGGPPEEGPADNAHVAGPSDDGPSDDGPSGDGPSGDGPSDDGPSDDGPSDDGPSDDGPADGLRDPTAEQLGDPGALERDVQEADPLETDAPAPRAVESAGLTLEPWAAWFTARVGLALSIGVLPAPSFGVAAELGLRFGLFEAALGFQWHSETERVVVEGRGGRFSAYEGVARVGIALGVEAFELAPSVRLGVGAMTGRGFGVGRAFTGVTPWLGLGGGLELRVRFALSPGADLALFVGGDALAGLTRPAFVLLGAETVYTPSEIAASFSAGLRGFFGGREIE